MWERKDEYFVRCDCGETEFMLSFWFSQENYVDKDDKQVLTRELFISQRIDSKTFWGRIKVGLKYIFKPREILNHGEVMVDLNSSEGKSEIGGLIKFLQRIKRGTCKSIPE